MVKLPNKYSSWLVSETELTPKSTKIIKVSKLLDKKFRRKTNSFLIEGENALEACSRSGHLIELFCTKNYLTKNSKLDEILESSHLKINLINEKALIKITETENPSGIVGVSKTVIQDFIKSDLSEKTFILVLFDISDPGNLGTILRSADAFGADLTILVGNAVDILNGKVIRSSAGSIFNVEIRISDINNLTKNFEGFKGSIYQTKANAELKLENLDLKNPIVWIFGNEAHGLHDFPANLGLNVSIPMRGKTESLNVSTAATLCMYETAKSRSIK